MQNNHQGKIDASIISLENTVQFTTKIFTVKNSTSSEHFKEFR